MSARHDLIGDLEDAIASNNISRRADLLGRVSDLFVSGSTTLSDEQIALFDDVMGRLAAQIDETARAAFGHRLSELPNAPPNVLRALALDDAIAVSGTILSKSERLSEATVVEAAKTKSQQHLLAISKRATLPETVTDVLVDRGDQQVALNTAANSGARFSEHGYTALAERAETDDALALTVLARPEVPRQHLLKIFSEASEAVRRKLEAEDPSKGKLLHHMVAKASNKIQTNLREHSAGYASAYTQVHTLHHSRRLDERQLAAFAMAGKFDETAIGLALLCKLPIDLAERMMAREQSEEVIIATRAFGFSWDTAKALLMLRANGAGDFEQERAAFEKLTQVTAKKALGFVRMRDKSSTDRTGGANHLY